MATSTSPTPDGLRFFTLEASDCLERLNAALERAGPAGPAHDDFVAAARTLRGSATMHRASGMAELAQSVERVARALREGKIRWSQALAAAMVAAVDDLKLLLHAVRTWGPPESARVAQRAGELALYVSGFDDLTPSVSSPALPSPASTAYVARAVHEVADALLGAASRLDDEAAIDAMLAQVRTIRGIAAITDIPGASEILDGIERSAQRVDRARRVALFRASAAALRDSAELPAYRSAYAQALAGIVDADRIVPVASLGYGDPSSDIVHVALNPPTTRAERFRLEVVSQAEHLLLLVGEMRDAHQRVPAALADELTTALHAVRDVALSFGEGDVADLVATFTNEQAPFDFLTLNAIDDLAQMLADPQAPDLSTLAQGRAIDLGLGMAFMTPIPDMPARPKARPETRAPARTPTGPALQALLADGLSGLSHLTDEPLTTPPDRDISVPSSNVPADVAVDMAVDMAADVVPIESLFYRGSAALAHARSLRALVVPGTPPSTEVMNEILDLIDLAASPS